MPEYLYPVIPPAHQLWRQYPPLEGIASKTVARDIVDRRFKDALRKNVTKYTGTLPLTVHGHPVCKPKLCYGIDTTVDRIGQWFVTCAEPSCNNKYAIWLLPAGILQFDLFHSEPLRSLLFMREELKPVATKDSTRATAAMHSIERSPYYRSAFSDVYPKLAGQVMEKFDTQLPNPYPSPPSASHASSSTRPINNRKRAPSVTDTTPTRTVKRMRTDTSKDSTVIELSDSDGNEEADEVPFHVILWTANNTDPSTFVLRSSGRPLFALVDVEHYFAVRGIPRRNRADLQVYNPRTGMWSSLSWMAAFGHISKGQTVLMRGISVSKMPDFEWMKDMASVR